MAPYNVNSPVLFLIFNRPDTSLKVFQAIRDAQPKKLYIAADGPRPSHASDSTDCKLTRDIVRLIDWDCEVFTLFRNENLGCRNAISSAIDWFFSLEEEGIILEDDCLPNPSFFSFCDYLLEYYRHDTQVMHISGDQFGFNPGLSGDYYFTRFAHIWGWASWRRAWNFYDVDLIKYQDYRNNNLIRKLFRKKIHQRFWNTVFDISIAKKINTWDYQWNFAIWANQGLCIVPRLNLISNIGFDSGTHTHENIGHFNQLPTFTLNVNNHPLTKETNIVSDERIMYNMFQVSYWLYFKNKIRKIWNK